MTSETHTAGKKAGKGGKKNGRPKHQRNIPGGSNGDEQQQQPQSRVPPTGNEPELEPTHVEQHIGCSTCVVEIPCDGPMCCLAKLACQRLECGGNVCNNLEEYSKRATELKNDISSALEKNSFNQTTDQPIEVIKLKENIQKLSRLSDGDESPVCSSVPAEESTPISELKDGPKGTDQTEPNNNPAFNSVQPKSEKRISDIETKSTGSENNTEPQNKHIIQRSGFEPLNNINVNLDMDSKYLAIISALKPHFKEAPHLLEPISHKLASMSDDYRQLAIENEKQRLDNQRLEMIKQKLESLCRELQKSNNAIRVESLDLIKVEQGKTKEQNTKIQSTLSGVIKLFDENQQRNMSLRQENQELQIKLKSLLDHCDNWERSVETAMRQRDIENRLIKTELAKANLMKTEEKEKFLCEKQELLKILSMMQEQQHKIEGQEAKLRLDLSSYASKYDECQAVISKGMSRFQLESKKMLQQIEKSKQDYKVLLSKYESSNRRMVQLLEEKKCWDRAMSLANKKIDTLERLCRALSGRKLETDNKSLEDQNDETKPTVNKIKNKKPSRDSRGQIGNVTSTKKFVNETFPGIELTEPHKIRNIEESMKADSADTNVDDSSTFEVEENQN